MTYEEALAWFAEELADGMYEEECIQCNANKKAYEALEKQIPKKPRREPFVNIHSENLINYFRRCPSCDAIVAKYRETQVCPKPIDKYCWNCGQALDWSNAK